mmetsp:Transcript_42048/g.30267  ORF Transcript_42048/g.30267 Transcript_42048/m.30267 type:complete len:83 (-) Transcript_42048:1404-1652(-)
MLAGALTGRRDTGQGFVDYDENAAKDANLLAGDAIANYRTVASFAHDDEIVAEFERLLAGPVKKAVRTAHTTGFLYGFSQFI